MSTLQEVLKEAVVTSVTYDPTEDTVEITMSPKEDQAYASAVITGSASDESLKSLALPTITGRLLSDWIRDVIANADGDDEDDEDEDEDDEDIAA